MGAGSGVHKLSRDPTLPTLAVAEPHGRDYVRWESERRGACGSRRFHRCTRACRRSCTAAPSGWSHFLTEALVDLGHDVTLFASGDSTTRARAGPVRARGAAPRARCEDPIAPPLRDDGGGVRAAPTTSTSSTSTSTTSATAWRAGTRSRTSRRCTAGSTCRSCDADLPARSPRRRWSRSRTRSASRCPRANWRGTVYHGLPIDCIVPSPSTAGYLAFLGRDLAREAGRPRGRDRAPAAACR